MKRNALLAIGCLFLFLGTTRMTAQENKPAELKIQKHTVMEQFEPDMVLSVDNRRRLKEKRKNTFKRRKGILDTLDISERRRQRLLKALLKNPFSDQLNKALADIEFEDKQIDN